MESGCAGSPQLHCYKRHAALLTSAEMDANTDVSNDGTEVARGCLSSQVETATAGDWSEGYKDQFAKLWRGNELPDSLSWKLTLALPCSPAKLFPLPTGPAELPASWAIVLKPRSAVQVTKFLLPSDSVCWRDTQRPDRNVCARSRRE